MNESRPRIIRRDVPGPYTKLVCLHELIQLLGTEKSCAENVCCYAVVIM